VRGEVYVAQLLLAGFRYTHPPESHSHLHSQKKKVQKLSLGRYLFKRYTFVPKGCILVPSWYTKCNRPQRFEPASPAWRWVH